MTRPPTNAHRCKRARALASLGLWLVLFGAKAVQAAPLILGIGNLSQFATLLIAEHQGYYAAEGLDVKIVRCVNGRECLKRMTDGEVQVTAAVELPIMFAASAGHRLDIVATIATAPLGNRFIVRGDRGIRTAADLKGKRIGFLKGTGGHYYTHLFLLFHGVDPASVTQVALEEADAPGALIRSKVDAAGFYEPHAFIAQAALGGNVVLLTSPRLQTATVNLVSLRADQDVDDEALRRLLRALRRAQQFMAVEPVRSREILASALHLEPALLRASLDVFDYRLSLPQLLVTSLEAEWRWAVREKLASGRVVPDFLRMFRVAPMQALDPRAVTVVR